MQHVHLDDIHRTEAAVDVGQVLRDLLHTRGALLRDHRLAEIVVAGFGGDGLEGNVLQIALAAHHLHLQQLRRFRANDQLGAGGNLLLQRQQVGIHLGQRIKGHAGGIHRGLHRLPFRRRIGEDFVAAAQRGNDVLVGGDGAGQEHTVHQANVVQKAYPHGGVLPFQIGLFDGLQKRAQMVALGGDVAQFPVHINSGAVDDFVAGGAENGVRRLTFRHGGARDSESVGGLDVPLGVRHLGAGFRQNLSGGVDAALHILAGVFKHLLGGHKADALAVYLHVQDVLAAQRRANHRHQAKGRRHRQNVRQCVKYQRKIPLHAPFQIAAAHGPQLLGRAAMLGQFPHVADAAGQLHEGCGEVLQQRDDAQQKGTQHGEQQPRSADADASADPPDGAHRPDSRVLHTKPDAVQRLSDQLRVGQRFQNGGKAVAAGFLFLVAPPRPHRAVDSDIIQPAGAGGFLFFWFFSVRGIQKKSSFRRLTTEKSMRNAVVRPGKAPPYPRAADSPPAPEHR